MLFEVNTALSRLKSKTTMKDSFTKFLEVLDTLEAQMKFLEGIEKARQKKRERELRLCQRAVSLRIRNLNNVDDFLKWFGTNKTRAVFEAVFLSENTKVLVESIFWWIYLDLLEPTKHQSKELLFSRMAEKYVAMLMSIPTGYSDVILDKIPKALSQATYVAFFDGLRTHHKYFDDNFKQYIFSYITKWTTGVTPQPGAANKERDKMAELTGERTETIAEMLTNSILSNKPVKLDITMQDLEDQQKYQENKTLFKVSSVKEGHKASVTKDAPKQKETREAENLKIRMAIAELIDKH
ncbi:Hypothetical predicted protein [Octopus vulgaris]|uniref:Uncharacterized protein n=1 Tax=Octopus vulgaris TaxID=6645 RepID=A0AA36AQH7_OCTVU|nr:Hypothetical predicted protein [Octopus vulgaris]